MVRSALAWARGEKLKVVPQCSYTARFIERHPEYADLLVTA
jgi:predicted GNAT family acetyltransferase